MPSYSDERREAVVPELDWISRDPGKFVLSTKPSIEPVQNAVDQYPPRSLFRFPVSFDGSFGVTMPTC
jgi:hypothetical protein